MYIRYETDRHESVCVQGTHRLEKAEHFQNRSIRIGVCARYVSSAKVDNFQTGLQKSVCMQVALREGYSRRCCGVENDHPGCLGESNSCPFLSNGPGFKGSRRKKSSRV
ncbi:hypothetical protein AVEN_51717-1 [Araneus ventricosus]|uniref:Uncharacterized protein n=1 Tax=Araneus ventricosus TaxID=182803 RepID=A0A4Y2GEN2_ARAVE|nr:hypothetical protein AVEN_51717-1 [Araneus ventricosus]